MTSYNVASHGPHSQHYSIRRLRLSDLRTALTRGLEDFWAMPSHLVFLALLYPVAGVVIGVVTAGENLFYLLYPLLSGFVLLGPFAAIGLFEMSRRRELGENPTWRAAFAVLHAPGISTILGLGGLLGVLFFGWLVVAQSIYSFYFGDEPARSYFEFFNQVFGSEAGLQMIIVGNVIGLLFAIVAMSISVFSFPLALDKHVTIDVALRTSLQAVWINPLQIAVWGLIVGALMFVGMAVALVGLALVMPILAHATWHLYRRTVGSPIA